MEWVKLAAVPAYYADASLLRAGEAAEVLFCRALAHCGSVESKGKVDKAVLPLLIASKSQARAAALVREGLWIDRGDHYLIRSWDRWQDAHDVAAEKRRQDRLRQREKRRRDADMSRDSHADSHVTKRDCHGVEGEGEGEREVFPDLREDVDVDVPRIRDACERAVESWGLPLPPEWSESA